MDFTPTSSELAGIINERDGEDDGEGNLGLKTSEFEDDIINNNVYGGFRGFGGFGGYVNKHRHYAIHYDEQNNINLSTEMPIESTLENTEEIFSQNDVQSEGEGEQEYESENDTGNARVEFEVEASEDKPSFQQPVSPFAQNHGAPSQREDLLTVTLPCESCKTESQIERFECLAPGPRDDRFTFLCSNCSGSEKPFFQHLTKSWLQIVSTALFNLQLKYGQRPFHIRDELCVFIEDHWNELCMAKQNTYNWNGTVSSQLFAHLDLFAQPHPKEWCLKNIDAHTEKLGLQRPVKKESNNITLPSSSRSPPGLPTHSPPSQNLNKLENKSDASQSESLGSSAEHDYTSFFTKRQTRSSSRGTTSVEPESPNDSPLDTTSTAHIHYHSSSSSNSTDHHRHNIASNSQLTQLRPTRAKGTRKKSKNRGGSSVRWCHQCKVLKPNTSDCCNPDIPLPLLAFVHAHQSQSSAICEKRFCEGCLRKYGEDRKIATTTKDWMCPFCRDICSCAACRRRRESQQWKQHKKSLAASNSSNPSSNANSPPSSQPQTPVAATSTTSMATHRVPVQVSGGFIKSPNGRLKVDAYDLERFVPSITLPESRPTKSVPIKEVLIPSFKKIRKYDFENDPRVESGEVSVKGDWSEEWNNPNDGVGIENNFNENPHFLDDDDVEKSSNNHFGEKHERDIEMGFDSRNQVSEWGDEAGTTYDYSLRRTSQRMRVTKKRGSRSSRAERKGNVTLESFEIDTGGESDDNAEGEEEEEDTSDEAYSNRHTKMYYEDRLAIRSERRLQNARNNNNNNDYNHNNHNNNHHDHPVNLAFLESEPLADILEEEGNYTSDFNPPIVEPRTKQSKKY